MKITKHEGLKDLIRVTLAGVGLNIEEWTASCTGPQGLDISFRRSMLHELEIGPEFVKITLTEEVE